MHKCGSLLHGRCCNLFYEDGPTAVDAGGALAYGLGCILAKAYGLGAATIRNFLWPSPAEATAENHLEDKRSVFGFINFLALSGRPLTPYLAANPTRHEGAAHDTL